LWQTPLVSAGAAIPHISEPWYCCAEPTHDQFVAIGGAPPPPAQPQALAQAGDFL
jgi:hypothetical protein